MNRNQKSNNKKEPIFEEESDNPSSSPPRNQYSNLNMYQSRLNQNNSEEEEEEGQIVSKSQQPEEPDNIPSQNQNLYDSSQDDQARMEKEIKKRQLMRKNRNQQEKDFANFSEEDLLIKAFEDIEKTNKRIMLLRKKNQKRIQDIQKLRMTQQPYLITSNTHYRGSTSQYPINTYDIAGKIIYHPNHSLKIPEMKLQHFIQKNIKEENSANYLNEVVKFQNYAYQQRKKRRHHIE